MHDLRDEWLKAGYDLDVSVGVAAGYATLGEIGFEGRRDYAAVGNVPNLVGCLCDAATEGEVAALVAQGMTNREIGKTLFVTERTAESHVQRIMNKLGFHARTQIAAWAIARGLHKLPDK